MSGQSRAGKTAGAEEEIKEIEQGADAQFAQLKEEAGQAQSQAVAALSDPGYTTAVAKIDWYRLLGEQVRLIGTPLARRGAAGGGADLPDRGAGTRHEASGPLVRRRCRQRGLADRYGAAVSDERTATDASAGGAAAGSIPGDGADVRSGAKPWRTGLCRGKGRRRVGDGRQGPRRCKAERSNRGGRRSHGRRGRAKGAAPVMRLAAGATVAPAPGGIGRGAVASPQPRWG